MAKKKTEILVIEDDADWQRELKQILEKNGYQVTIAGTYSEAMAAIRKDTAKVAVVDLSLKPDRCDRHGVDVMKSTRMPVVCVSGTMFPGEGDKLFGKGLVEWYFTKDEFANQVNSFLAQIADSIKIPNAEISKRWKIIERSLRQGD